MAGVKGKGGKKGCGRVAINLIGQKFGRLTVVSRAENLGGVPAWNCICECGRKKTTRGSTLRRGHVKSCGCLCRDKEVGPGRKYPTPKDAAWAYPCYYCGALPEKRPSQRGRSSILASGIDRVDNNVGYIADNVVPCCTWCNQAKNSHSAEDFIKHCRSVAQKANAAIARNE